MAILKCLRCNHKDREYNFLPSFSPYHDVLCPKCHSSNVDTAELNKEWTDRGDKYGYGNGNVLNMNGSKK